MCATLIIGEIKETKMQTRDDYLEEDAEEEFDGNVFELKYDSSNKSWSSTMNVISGNMWPKENFTMSTKKRPKKANKRRLIDEFFDLLQSDGWLFNIGGLILLSGYLMYRYLYLKRRNTINDRVDLMLKNRFNFQGRF